MPNFKAFLFFLLLMASVFFGCQKIQEFPDTPAIAFLDFPMYGKDSAKFIFSFTDGDGDIGLADKDTIAPYDSKGQNYYNLFLTYYEKENGTFKEIPMNPPFYYRVPVITPEGRDKSLQGKIQVTLAPLFYNPFTKNKAFRYDAYLVDRALNKSNVISTGEIQIP